MRLVPTSYVERIAREKSNLPGSSKSYEEWLEQLNAIYGLDLNPLMGFIKWLGSAVQCDFGDSWVYNIPCTEKFAQVIWYSFFLSVVTMILEVLIAIPLGIIAAKNQYGKIDYAVTCLALLGVSLPTFFIATILKLVFSVKLKWFDLFGAVGRYHETLGGFDKFLDLASHYVLPVITLVLVSVGGLMRYTRTNMLEVLNADYIRTARAKGLPEKVVINKHAFRNTLIPLVTALSSTLPGLFGGAMITETLFQIPGIGYISYGALASGDIPFTMFYMMFIAALTLVGFLIADIMYAVVDPRVRID